MICQPSKQKMYIRAKNIAIQLMNSVDIIIIYLFINAVCGAKGLEPYKFG